MDGESFSHYLQAKNKLRSPSPQKKQTSTSLKAQVKPVSALLKHEIWQQSVKQMETQLLQSGSVNVPHLGSFWIQKYETELPGAGVSTSYSINFLIEESVSPHMYKMKVSTLGKSLPESSPLDLRRISIDLGSVTKERVRTFLRDFAQQLSLEIKKLSVSSQVPLPLLEFGKITFTATTYSVRWDKTFLGKVKDAFKKQRDDKVVNKNIEQRTSEPSQSAPEPVEKNDAQEPEPPKRSTSPRKTLQLAKKIFGDESSLQESQSLLLPSLTKDDDAADTEAQRMKKELHEKWLLQMKEKEQLLKKERESELKQREFNETVAELFSESEKKKNAEKRMREKKTMNDNLQIAELVKNIRDRGSGVVECGDIFEKRRVDHPVFSREQLLIDLKLQMDEKSQKLAEERNAQLEMEREEFLRLQQLNKTYKSEMQNTQNQKIKLQKQLLEQQIRDNEAQAKAMYEQERIREASEQVLVPGHDDEIAKNSKKLAQELLHHALSDVERKKQESKRKYEEDTSFARTQAELLKRQEEELKQQQRQKQKETQKEMKKFWDTQVGGAQWKNPTA